MSHMPDLSRKKQQEVYHLTSMIIISFAIKFLITIDIIAIRRSFCPFLHPKHLNQPQPPTPTSTCKETVVVWH